MVVVGGQPVCCGPDRGLCIALGHAQTRQTDFAGDELMSREADRFPGGEFRDAPRLRSR